jgi:epsilon-lactone hydrolase
MRLVTAVLRHSGEKRILSDADRTAADIRAKAAAGPAPVPRRTKRHCDITSHRIAGLSATTVVPAGTALRQRSIVYLPGGSYTYPLVKAHWWLITALARENNARVHVIFYPLAPDGTVATVVPAVADAVAEIAAEEGGSPVLAGDSAGGGLALAVTHHLRQTGRKPPEHLVLLSPWLDAELAHPAIDALAPKDPSLARPGLLFSARLWADGLDLSDPLVSPAHLPVEGLCPTTAVFGTNDILYPDEQDWVRRALEAGVDLATYTAADGFHVFIAATALPESVAARSLISRRLRPRTAGPSEPADAHLGDL